MNDLYGGFSVNTVTNKIDGSEEWLYPKSDNTLITMYTEKPGTMREIRITTTLWAWIHSI